MNKIFRRFLKSRTQGDEEKELFWWEFFFNYEVGIGFVIATIFCLVSFSVMAVFSAFTFGFKIFDSILFVIGISLLIGGLFAFFIVSPLNDNKNVRKENLKQGSLYMATALGHIANFIINWAPLLALVASFLNFKWNVFIGCCAGVALYYILLSLVKPNAKDYVNWRFSWAIDNYESLFSGHYKWWTSAANMSVQKFHLKKFQNYKYHATLSLIMVPVLFTLSLFSGTGFATKGMNRSNKVQVSTDSISTPDVVENTTVDEGNNVDAEQFESDEPDEFLNQDEDAIEVSGGELSGFYRLSGHVANLPVEMELNIDGNAVEGSYFYTGVSHTGISLYGSIKDGHRMELREINDNNELTGIFVGDFDSGVYSGTFYRYRNGNNDKTFDFRLQ